MAGAIAGPSMLLTGLETQHTSLAIYILMRAAVLAARCGIKSKRFGHICKPLTWSHGDILLMCLSSTQILWVSFLHKSDVSSIASYWCCFLLLEIQCYISNPHCAVVNLFGNAGVSLINFPLPST